MDNDKLMQLNLKDIIRDFPDFPRPGILFRDITTVFKSPDYYKSALLQMEAKIADINFEAVIAPESRGFMLGAPMAYNLHKGFIPARKKGKLPGEVVKKTYFLEYGMDSIEIHKDAIIPGQKYIIVDDLLATGGTAKGICDIVEELGASIEAIVFLIELSHIKGRDVLKNYRVETVLTY